MQGFTSKAGKLFDAYLKLNEEQSQFKENQLIECELIGEVKNVLRKRYEGHHEERERRRCSSGNYEDSPDRRL